MYGSSTIRFHSAAPPKSSFKTLEATSHTCQGPIPTWQNHQETKWIKVVTTIRAWLLLSLFFGPGAPFPALIQPATCICLRRLPGYWTKLKATNHAGWSWFMLQICMDFFISLEGHAGSLSRPRQAYRYAECMGKFSPLQSPHFMLVKSDSAT